MIGGMLPMMVAMNMMHSSRMRNMRAEEDRRRRATEEQERLRRRRLDEATRLAAERRGLTRGDNK